MLSHSIALPKPRLVAILVVIKKSVYYRGEANSLDRDYHNFVQILYKWENNSVLLHIEYIIIH